MVARVSNFAKPAVLLERRIGSPKRRCGPTPLSVQLHQGGQTMPVSGPSRFAPIAAGSLKSAFHLSATSNPTEALTMQSIDSVDCSQVLAANRSQRPGKPLSSCEPRSENFSPAPATRYVTTL